MTCLILLRECKQCWGYLGVGERSCGGSKAHPSVTSSNYITWNFTGKTYRWHMDAGLYHKHILILLFIRLEIGGAEHLFSGVKCKSTTYTNKRTPTNPRRPWLSCLDINLSRETETHLWDCILLLMSCLFDDDPHVVYRSNQNHSWSIARWITLGISASALKILGGFHRWWKSKEVKLDGFGGGEYLWARQSIFIG